MPGVNYEEAKLNTRCSLRTMRDFSSCRIYFLKFIIYDQDSSVVSLQRLSSKYKHTVPSTSQSKSPTDDRQEEVYSHSSVSLLSQATFWWLTPLLWKGAAKPLELSDLGKLPKEEGTERCYHTFNQCYEALKVFALVVTKSFF